ncbi:MULTISPECIES: GGDEF domain-containing protein [Comamonas]|jgi:diguanylate cyclase (GGDEF)-like protein|uniref:GGDEF domain-containing protein n=1 Tax=Comamonas TaxID=283 RepID=UPI000621A9A3|nr:MULTISPECIES: GGDEF domain-containing protein [Comamonas]KKI11682.1 diguanylate cyclase [Comamonas thiooxydans]QOQ83831.1 GGDEF domain-containing protein [Comamonas thiooxydans]TYK71119.1 GGDEF domain-containing protein [Comamonas sp. Z1]TYK73140.1 GGDEF domain-containing protein [Comamonas sp. Z3]GAO68662.1 diguanylate cyclase [Comamonas sp. E6]
MSANYNLLVLTPPLALLVLAAVLMVAWFNQRSQRFLFWQACAYSLTALPLAAQTLIPLEVLTRYALLIGSIYLLGAWCLAKCWADRWRVSTHPHIALQISIVTLAVVYHFSWVNPIPWVRICSFSIGSGLVLMLPILQVRSRMSSLHWLDKLLLWLSIAFTTYTFTRPGLIWLLGYSDLRSLPKSPYWLLTLVSILNFALLFSLVMTAIAAKETVDKLRRERDLDALTQLLNRRSFQEYAQQRLADIRLYPMAVLACDIDHFKRINDSWGHKRGDEVLQLVSTTLKDSVRENDLVARFGGEEFVLLLTEISLKDAEAIALRIQRDLRLNNEVLPSGYTLTLSFGISALDSNTPLDQALREADRLLYEAKNAGRDRVHVSGGNYPDISIELDPVANPSYHMPYSKST